MKTIDEKIIEVLYERIDKNGIEATLEWVKTFLLEAEERLDRATKMGIDLKNLPNHVELSKNILAYAISISRSIKMNELGI